MDYKDILLTSEAYVRSQTNADDNITGLVISSITIIVASTITDSGVARTRFSPVDAETDITYSSSNPDIATIDPDTGQITVLQNGEVIFCTTDTISGLYDCKLVNVVKSVEPGPDTGDTGETPVVISSITIIVDNIITDYGEASSVFSPASAETDLRYLCPKSITGNL